MTTRVAPTAKARRTWSGPSIPPPSWRGTATSAAIRPMASRFSGLPSRAPSRSTTWMSGAPRSTKWRAIRSGLSVGAPVPVAAPGQKTTRDRAFSRSMLGMTCTTWPPPRLFRYEPAELATRPLPRRRAAHPLAQQPPVEADRDAARVEQAVVEAAQREVGPEPALLVLAQPHQQDLADQVSQLVGR